MGIGIALVRSGALWLHPIALGKDAGSSPLWSIRAGSEHIPVLISVAQRFPRLSGYCLQCAGLLSVRYGFPRYLGWLLLLGRRMGAYLFSTKRLVYLCISTDTLLVLLDSLYVSLCITMDIHRYSYSYL